MTYGQQERLVMLKRAAAGEDVPEAVFTIPGRTEVLLFIGDYAVRAPIESGSSEAPWHLYVDDIEGWRDREGASFPLSEDERPLVIEAFKVYLQSKGGEVELVSR